MNERLVWEIGQRMAVGFPGTELPDQLRQAIKRRMIGNVIFFSRNLVSKNQISELSGSIRELIKDETGLEPWIMIDQEGGMVSRLPADCPQAPSAMALSALGDENAAYQSALETARVLRELGCNVNLAPVLDVNSNYDNPVIGCRSFGDAPEKVVKMTKWIIKGYHDGGVLSCGKHFPGHGDTALDSHLKLPVVNSSRDELESHLIPFKAAIQEGIESIMTSHVLFPALEEEVPCTMSRAMITGLLRNEMKFNGLVFSDCMQMQAISKYYGTAEGIARAFDAGIDHVLVSHDYSKAVEAMEEVQRRFDAGLLDREQWNQSMLRIVRAKESFAGRPCPEAPSCDAVEKLDGYAQSAVTLASGSLPPLGKDPLFIGPEAYITSNVQDKLSIRSFADSLQSRFGGRAIIISADPKDDEVELVIRNAKGRQVYLGTYNGHLQRGQIDIAVKLGEAGIPLVVIALRNPYDLERPVRDAASACLAAYEYSPRIFQMIGDIIEGKRMPQGRLPVQLR